MAEETKAPAAPVPVPLESRIDARSPVSSTLSVRTVEIPQQIKAAISQRIAAELLKK